MSTFDNGFLKDVAQFFAGGHPGMPPHQDIVYILPNKRGALFLKKHIHATMTRPGRMPRIMTMRNFLNSLAGFPEAQDKAEIFMLYQAYRTVMQRRGAAKAIRPFDSFVFWGDMIAGDFDEIDKSMVSADEIFCNLQRLKEIQADYLDEDQKEVVRRIWGESRLTGYTERFWLHTAGQEPGHTLAHKFVSLWDILAEGYHCYKDILHTRGLISSGDSYRMAVDKLRTWTPDTLPPHTHYAFVGFNDASVAESLVFQRLKDLGMAYFLWDTAPLELFGDTPARPLRRLAQLAKAFPAPYGFNTHSRRKQDIKIDIYAIPSRMMQAKCAGEAIARWCDTGSTDPADAIDTSVVLPDQTMLQPLMFSIPEQVEHINVSMGLPYRTTTFAALLRNIISMQLRARTLHGSYHYFYEDVCAVLTHPHMRYIDSIAADKVLDHIRRNKLFNISAAELCRDYPVFSKVFTPVHDLNDVESVGRYLTDLFRWLADSLADATEAAAAPTDTPHAPFAGKFEHKVLEYLIDSVESLTSLAREYDVEMADRTFLRLFERMLNHSEVPATGTPLAGLQVLGVLETRTLDFKNVAVLSMNERIFPRRQYSHTLIPGAIRAGYGLPAPDSLENTYAFCFYRLVARASNLALFYDSRRGIEGSGEMSRYINQLLYLIPDLDIKHHHISLSGTSTTPRAVSVTKTPEVMAQVNRLRAGGDLKLSATALKEYKHCPLAFYLKYVRGLRDEDEVVDYMNNADHGTIVHNVIQKAFERFGSKPITYHDLDALADPSNTLLDDLALREVTAHKYPQYHNRGELLPAEGRIAADLISLIARSDIRAERDAYCAGGRTFTFQGAEVKIERPWTITPELTVNWKMSIDRVDALPDGSLRFIDFKTGSDERNVTLASLAQYHYKKEGVFQLLSYCQAYRDIVDASAQIHPVIHITRELTRSLGISDIIIDKKPLQLYTEEFGKSFEPVVKDIIASIFDPTKPFGQSSDESDCTYCPFKDTCGRYPSTDR